MKIQSLHIENIASFEDVTVSFDSGPLGNADVFLICGAVGTGKSTILDCITLALYGRTPRLNNQGGNQTAGRDLTFNGSKITDPRQLKRRGTPRGQQGRVTLLFEADGHDYEAVWQTTGTKKEARTLTDLTTHTVRSNSKEVDAEIERLLHLDFDQFCRTTTLSQGEFAKFLRSNDDEKAAILEKIVGVEIYARIGAQIYEMTARAKQDADMARTRIEGLQVIGDERLAAINAELKTLNDETLRLAAKSREADGEMTWLTQSAKLAAQQARAAEEFGKAKEERDGEAYAMKAQTVADYDTAAEARATVTAKATITKKTEETMRTLRLDSEAFAALLGRTELLESDTRRLEAEKTNLEKELQAHDSLKAVYENIKVLTASEADLKAATKSVAEIEAEIAGMRREIDNRLRTGAEEASAKVEKCKELESEAERRLADAAHTAAQRELPRLVDAIGEADRNLTQRKKEVEKAELTHEALVRSTSRGVRELRSTLTAGCLCPVCRQPVSELPADLEFNLQKALASSRSLLEELRSQADKQRDALTRLTADRDLLKVEIEATGAAPEGYDPAIVDEPCDAARLKTLRGDLSDARTELIAAQNRQTKADTLLAKSEEKIAGRQGVLTVTKANAAEARKKILAIAALGGEATAANADADTGAFVADMEKRCAEYGRITDAVDRATTTLTSRRELLYRLHSKREKTEALLAGRFCVEPRTATEAGAKTIEPEYDALVADTGVAVSRLETLAAERENADRILTEFLAAGTVSAERLEQLAAMPAADISRLRKETETTASRLATAEGAVRQCAELIADHEARRPEALRSDEPPTIEAIAAAKAETDRQLDELRRRAGALTQQIEADAANRAERVRLLEEHTRLAAVYAGWKELCDLLGDKNGSRFRRIALSFVLDNLIRQANNYMTCLTDRYTLALKPGSFIILVRDAYQGFAERATTTISGGETFMVSLALALALSDIGGNVRGADILFIDEGFGSLSGEDLHNAVDMLRNLQKSAGRRVGIISHIPELAERIPVQLRVSRIGRTAASNIEIVS